MDIDVWLLISCNARYYFVQLLKINLPAIYHKCELFIEFRLGFSLKKVL